MADLVVMFLSIVIVCHSERFEVDLFVGGNKVLVLHSIEKVMYVLELRIGRDVVVKVC